MHSIIKLDKTHLKELLDFQDSNFHDYENIHNNLLYQLPEDLAQDIAEYDYYGLFINSKLCGVISFYERELMFSEEIILSHINSIKVPEKFYYLAHAAVLKDHEGNKIMSKLVAFVLENLPKGKLKHAAIAINTDNKKMEHIILKNNFKPYFNIENITNNRGKFAFFVKKI